MERTIRNYKLSLILVLISYIIMLVFNFFNFFDGDFIHIIYGIIAIIVTFALLLGVMMATEVVENSVKISMIVTPVVFVIMFLDAFVGGHNSPFKSFRVVGWVQLVGSIEAFLKAKKISKGID